MVVRVKVWLRQQYPQYANKMRFGYHIRRMRPVGDIWCQESGTGFRVYARIKVNFS